MAANPKEDPMPTNEEQEVTRERGDGGQWERVTEWQTVQPIHCTRCGHTYEGREAGYLPAMCDEPDCAIPIDPRRVVTVRIATESSR